MTKATEDIMAEIHGLMGKNMLERLKSDDPITPAELSIMRQWLKDNGITSDPATDESLKSIAADLPDDLDDGSIIPLYGN